LKRTADARRNPLSDRNQAPRVMECLNRLGYDIEIKVRPAAEPIGHLTLATV